MTSGYRKVLPVPRGAPLRGGALRASDLAAGDIVAVEVEGVALVVYRIRDRIVAAQRHCPHAGNDLSDGLLTSTSLLCAGHGWRFDATTGAHDSSSACLRIYPAREVDGDVEVSIERAREP